MGNYSSMEAKMEQLVASVTGMISEFLITEVGEYKENYEHMLNSPLCKKLLSEISELRAENEALKQSSTKPNIMLEISEDDSDN